MKSLLFVLLFVAPLAGAAPAEVRKAVLELGEGRNVELQIAKPAASSKPTFLFLPGVNRGLLLEEPAAKALVSRGYGVVAFNFSVQPLSLATLPSSVRPAFFNEEVSLVSLAAETELVARAIERTYGIRGLIPVSLSYSGAVSRFLEGFRLVIDSVPLTSMDAFSPDLVMYKNWILATSFGNPLYVRYWLDAGYELRWRPQVAAISRQFNLPSNRAADMVAGYVRLSRATENFVWSARGDRQSRIFLIAGGEAKHLLANQIRLLLERMHAGHRDAIVLVEGTGHIVPAEQPLIYATALTRAAAGELKAGLNIVTPGREEWRHLPPAQAETELRQRARDLPPVP